MPKSKKHPKQKDEASKPSSFKSDNNNHDDKDKGKVVNNSNKDKNLN